MTVTMDGGDPYRPIFDEGATRALYYDTPESQQRYHVYPVSETVARPGTRKSRRIESQAAVGVVPGLPVPRAMRGVAIGRAVHKSPNIPNMHGRFDYNANSGHVFTLYTDMHSDYETGHYQDYTFPQNHLMHDYIAAESIAHVVTTTGAVYPENEPSEALTVQGFESPITRWDLVSRLMGWK